jgi:HupF/HypC family
MTPPDRRASVAQRELHPPLDHEMPCITCRDSAIRMRVLEVDEPRELALCVDEHERRHRVDTGLVPAVAPGEALLVHAGAALVREPV